MPREVDCLIVEDDPQVARSLERLCRQKNYSYTVVSRGEDALQFMKENHASVVLLDLYLPDLEGSKILKYTRQYHPEVEVIIATGRPNIKEAVEVLKLGASDYLAKPFHSIDEVGTVLKTALEKNLLKNKLKNLESQSDFLKEEYGFIGQSKAIQQVYEVLEDVSRSTASVLILGESGTGKELIARAIHALSPRKSKPFVVINCSSLPEPLMESELFGFVKGAFTGATQDRIGLFEEANGGTVFLDEIGDVPASIQVKLLRVLQEREIRRVGEEQVRKVDVRILAATHRDLKAMIEEGSFRQDLYYRLNVISLQLPALRERKEDVPLLANYFLQKLGRKIGKNARTLSLDAMEALQNYPWPGNVRELENTIERSLVLSESPTLHARDLPPRFNGDGFYYSHQEETDLFQFTYQEAKKKALDLFHSAYLKHLLRQSNGNLSIASTKAGMDRSNFKKIVKKFRIDTAEFKG